MPESSAEISEMLVLGNQIVHPTVMLRSEVFSRLGGYKKSLHAEDYRLWIDMVRSGMKLFNIRKPLLKYRMIEPGKITIKKKFMCGITTMRLKLNAWRTIEHRVSPHKFGFNMAKELAWILIDAVLPARVIYRIHRKRVISIYSHTLPASLGGKIDSE
jgi:hypothetical protein